MSNKTSRPVETFIGGRAAVGGYPRVHLVYPNTYHVGMSSLALHAVYKCLVDAGCAVERVFMPEQGHWRTFESSRALSDCDVIAFSISFEGDYLSVIDALAREGLLSATGPRPLLIAGGAAVTLNPEPLAALFDLICIGEAEEFIPELVAALRASSSSVVLSEIARIAGAYVPSLVDVEYDGPRVSKFNYREGIERPRRRVVKDLSRFPTSSQILTPDTEFSSMFMAETGRGCENGCKFCAAGYLYRPIRKQKPEILTSLVKAGVGHTQKLGLVGAAVSSHPALLELCREAGDAGARAGLSSLMAYRMTPELGAEMRRMGVRSVAIAPEAGSERLRYFIGKRVQDPVFIEAARELRQAGVVDLKLYFMIGLPGEDDSDVDAIISLSSAVVAEAPGMRCTLSVSPFIPKASTPFQWKGMADVKTVDRKLSRLKKAVHANRALRMNSESARESQYQALLSRGDRRLTPLLFDAVARGQSWKDVLKAARDTTPDLEWVVHREWGADEVLPWDIVDSGISKALLLREADRDYGARASRLR